MVNTGEHTARAAADKSVVREETTENKIWWGEYNRPFSVEEFKALVARVQAFAQDEEFFIQDCHARADSEYRLRVRIITEKAWQSLFARNMFLTIYDQDELKHFVP